MTVTRSEERIEITAHVEGATRGIGQVNTALGNLRTGADAVKGALAAIGVTLGAGAMAAYAIEVVKATAALGNLAQATGASVENLSRLQTVAKVGGHDFDGVSAAIGTLIKNLKGADTEGEAAARALESLGVQARQSNGTFRDSVEIIVDLAKALAEYEDDANKFALVWDVLGKQTQKYLPLLKDIAEEGLGAAKTTRQQQEEAERLEKSVRRLRMAFDDAKQELVKGWVPVFSQMLEQLVEGHRLFGGFASALYNIGFAIDPLKSVADNLRQVRGELEHIERLKAAPAYAAGYLVQPGTSSDEGTLRKRLAFLQLMERQRALELTGPQYLDARDLRARPALRPTLGHPGGAGKEDDGRASAAAGDDGTGLILSLRDQLAAASGEASVYDSVLRKLTEGTKQYSDQVKETALGLARQIDLAKKAKEAAEAQKKLDMEILRERNQFLEQQGKAIEQAEEELKKERERIEEIGLSADALVRLKEARIDDMIAAQERDIMASRAGETDEAYTRTLERQLEVLKARRGLVREETSRNAQVEAAKRANEEWQRTADSIERSLTDALTTPWDRSVSFAQRARDMIVSMFQRMVLEPVLRPVIQGVSGSIANMIVPQAARSIGGFPGGGFDLGGLFGGGGSGFLASGASVGAFGEVAGLTAMTEAAALGGAGAVAGGAGAMSLLGPAGLALGAMALLGGGDLFGGGGAPKPTQLGVLGGPGGFHVSQNDFAGAGVTALPGFGALNVALNDPKQYDPEVLAQHLGYFEGAPGESAEAMWQKLLQKIEPARRAAEQKQEDVLRSQKDAAKAMEDAAAALEAVQREEARVAAGLADAVRGLSGRLGIDTLQGAVAGLATSEYRSPMDRLNAARGIFQSTYAQALGGDLGAVQALPGAAQTLLGVGRSAYASGPGFQNLFVETNRALNDILARQQAVQNDLLRSVGIQIAQSGADTVAAVQRGFQEQAELLRALQAEVRRLSSRG